MKYQYSKTRKSDEDYTLIQPLETIDGFDIGKLTVKHGIDNEKVVIIQKDNEGRNRFSAINQRHLKNFNEFESFDKLDWKNGEIE